MDCAAHRPLNSLISKSMPKHLERFSEFNFSLIGPDSIVEPSFRNNTWLNPFGISSTWWVTITTGGDKLSETKEDNHWINSSRLGKSSPDAGSSSNTSLGSLIRLLAKSALCFSPEDKVPNLCFAR